MTFGSIVLDSIKIIIFRTSQLKINKYVPKVLIFFLFQVLILCGVVFLYVFFSINPFSHEDIVRLREEALQNRTSWNNNNNIRLIKKRFFFDQQKTYFNLNRNFIDQHKKIIFRLIKSLFWFEKNFVNKNISR